VQALILAAGRGSRLGQKSEQMPKCLLQLGHQRLVEHQLEILAEAGVAPVGMVVGYCADQIREVVGIKAEYIENTRWSVTNSLYSFWLAREWVKGPLLVLNSDTVVHPEILDRLLDEPGDAFAYDSDSGNAREHMKVRVEDGRLIDVSKQMPSAEASGENVGILKLTAETARDLFETAGRLVSNGHDRSWLGSGVQQIAKTHFLRAVDVAGVPWGEIDSCYDLELVRKSVLPSIRPDGWRRKLYRRAARWAAAVAAFLLLVFSGYLASRTWLLPPEQAWENLGVDNADKVKIYAGDRMQEWWMLQEGRVAAARVKGPDSVRVDSRVVLPDQAQGKFPYVLELNLDGKRLGWFDQSERPSTTWKHASLPVGRRDRIEVDVPEGSHTLGVSLVASDSGRCLVRIRQVATEDEED